MHGTSFMRAGPIEVGFLESGHFEKVLYEAEPQGFVAVNGNRKPDEAPGLCGDVGSHAG